MAELKVGKVAPAFNLQATHGEKIALKDLKGKTVVLYFYPKDMTPGCTTQACDFRDNMAKLKRKKVTVLGVSLDSNERHNKFTDKYDLNFQLLTDVDHKVCEKYGVWQLKKFMGKEYMGIVRSTFIIGADGKIAKIYDKVKAKGHVDMVLEDLKEIL